MNRGPALSERLRILADLVLPGQPMADIGTDHGALPYYCLARDLVPFAVLSDVNEGPLARAGERMERSDVAPDRYSLRLGSGLSVLQPQEVKTAVIAGMGGELISRLLEASPDVAENLQRLVLQPRNRSGILRGWLWENGWRIVCERLVKERGRMCQIFAAERGPQQPYEYPDIPECSDPLMIEFLDREIVNINIILDNLKRSSEPKDLKKAEAFKRKLSALEQRREGLWRNSSF